MKRLLHRKAVVASVYDIIEFHFVLLMLHNIRFILAFDIYLSQTVHSAPRLGFHCDFASGFMVWHYHCT